MLADLRQQMFDVTLARRFVCLHSIEHYSAPRDLPSNPSARPGMSALKLRIVRIVQRRIVNPPVRLMWRLGFVSPGFALLETTGRRTGRSHITPVGDGLRDDTFWVVAEHGAAAAYVRNLQANRRARVRLRQRGRLIWRSGTAHLMPATDPRTRQRMIVGSRISRRIKARSPPGSRPVPSRSDPAGWDSHR